LSDQADLSDPSRGHCHGRLRGVSLVEAGQHIVIGGAGFAAAEGAAHGFVALDHVFLAQREAGAALEALDAGARSRFVQVARRRVAEVLLDEVQALAGQLVLFGSDAVSGSDTVFAEQRPADALLRYADLAVNVVHEVELRLVDHQVFGAVEVASAVAEGTPP